MKLLAPGNGNQKNNRKKAIDYIVENLIKTETVDYVTGNIISTDGVSYQISAYAETMGAFIKTPDVDKSIHSIYASGLRALMYRQLKKDKRSFVYEIEPTDIVLKSGSSTALWEEIDKVSKRVWICTKEQIKLIERTLN